MFPRFSRRPLLALGVALVCLAGAGCGGESAQQPAAKGGDDSILRLAFFADMSTVDPDVFYDIEGGAVTQAVYEGLLRYKPGTTELEGALAESWEASDDGLTYTFKLRDDVKFSDGTPLDSEAVKSSFERRTEVGQGPAYMLADVRGYETPDPQTFVVELKKPVADFLELMASMWGPKAINPKVLEQNAGKDQGQTYLKEHAAGTGPYVLESFQRGTRYGLKRNAEYWGEEPGFEEVLIDITPDASAQLLKLQRGDLDAMLHGFPLANLPAIERNDDLKVEEFPSLGTTTLFLNHNKPKLKDVEVREAVIRALDVPTLVKSVYGKTATVPEGAYPKELLDPSRAEVDYSFDAEGAKDTLGGKGLTLDVVYTPDSSGVQRRLADLIRQKLALAGVTAKPRQAQLDEVFGYREDVQKAADIYVSTPTPDAAHPDAWGRIVWYTEGGLNFFNYSNPKVDAALDEGLRETDEDDAEEPYAEAGELAAEDWAVVPIAQVNDVVVHRADLTGVEHVPTYPWTVDLASIAR